MEKGGDTVEDQRRIDRAITGVTPHGDQAAPAASRADAQAGPDLPTQEGTADNCMETQVHRGAQAPQEISMSRASQEPRAQESASNYEDETSPTRGRNPRPPPGSGTDSSSRATLGHLETPDYNKWPFATPQLPHAVVKLYEAARSAKTRGTARPRVDEDLQLNTPAWEQAATGHHMDQVVIRGIKFGFALQYAGPPRYGPPATYNHSSALAYPTRRRW